MVRRAMNRAPSPQDPWWPDHQRTCGGTYVKVKEPENYKMKKRKTKDDFGHSKSNAIKGTPKIYDLWNKVTSKNNEETNKKNEETNKKKEETNKKDEVKTRKNDQRSGESCSSNGKENDIRKINFAFQPFTGKGRVLGDGKVSTVSNGNHTLLSGLGETSQAKVESSKDLSNSMQKKHSGNELTIVDAFRNSSGQKVPLVVLDSTSSESEYVTCPVCTNQVKKNLINNHLDSCL